jgi:hypothetical protein
MKILTMICFVSRPAATGRADPAQLSLVDLLILCARIGFRP